MGRSIEERGLTEQPKGIPLRNIVYMLAYSWNRIEYTKRIEVGDELDGPDTPAFFGKVLCQGCHQLFRRGLDRAYIPLTDELPGLRGKILIGETLRRGLLRRGRTISSFDELQYDALHNRLLKAVLVRLGKSPGLPPAIEKLINETIRTFDDYGVTASKPTRAAFKQVQLHRNNAFYSFLLQTAEFIVSHVFPDEHGLGRSFAQMILDDARLESIFEAFVRNFYRSEQSIYRLQDGTERLEWDLNEPASPSDEPYLPGMYPDMTLRSDTKTIVIDAKWYKSTFGVSHVSDRRKIHSSNLYQLFSYLKNLERSEGTDAKAEGILLYPQVDEAASLRYEVQGHTMRICTIDLNQPWLGIEASLLGLIQLYPLETSAVQPG
jgi:5-methylcytosine-specific restriction enzyme subunit McrC